MATPRKQPPSDARVEGMSDEARLRNAKAYAILYDAGLAEEVDNIYPKGKEFVYDMDTRFEKYGEDTFVSEGQLSWLIDLAKQYL